MAVPVVVGIEAIGAVMDKLGAEGWQYAGHLDKEVDARDVPGHLRGTKGEGGATLLGGKIPVHYLIFKRPVQE